MTRERVPEALTALARRLDAEPGQGSERTGIIMGQALGQPRSKHRTVLIVEDDAELRWLTATLLEESEFDAIECESAEAALAVMLIRGQDVNMIFADIRLPGVMDGIDLACEVKMRWPHLIIILTSGNPGERLEHLPARRPIHAEAVAAAQRSHGRRARENVSRRQMILRLLI